MSNSFYYWLGFIAYSLAVIGIGLYVWLRGKQSGQQDDNVEYWEASRNLSFWSVGLSISASMMSISWSCVYGVQLFYWYGWGGAWLLIIPWLITMAGFFTFAPRFRKFKAFSQPQLLEKHFGQKSRQMLAPALIVVFITWTGAEIFAAGTLIAPFLGLSLNWTLFLITLVVAIYTYSGGFKAVVSTDKIQFILVAFFVTTIAILGVQALPAGSSLWHIPLPPKANLTQQFFTPGLALITITFFAYLPGWLIETDVWIRLQAARSDRAARGGVFLAGINSFIFVGVMPLIIGLSALHLFPPQDGIIPAQLQDGALIFTVFMQNYAPMALSIFLVVGLIAASMSTIDTCGNIVALSFSYDLLEPQLQNKWPAHKLNQLARISSVAAIFASFVYAVFTESLWDIFYLSSGILTTTVFIPVVSSFLRGTKPIQVKLAIICGLVSTLVLYFLESRGLLKGIEPAFIAETGLGYIIWGFLCSLAGFIAGKFFPQGAS
jgi:solute:Na+ symporter, SSS family